MLSTLLLAGAACIPAKPDARAIDSAGNPCGNQTSLTQLIEGGNVSANVAASAKRVLPGSEISAAANADAVSQERLVAEFATLSDANSRCALAVVTERCVVLRLTDKDKPTQGQDLLVWERILARFTAARNEQCAGPHQEEVKVAEKATQPPPSPEQARIDRVGAYTNTDYRQPWVDEKQVNIPEGWEYSSHSWHETTGLGEKKISDWIVRDPRNSSRVIEVHIKVEAYARWFGRSWEGAELAVAMVRKR